MFVLDTNVLSEVLRLRPSPGVIRRLLENSSKTLFASELTRYELRFGAALRADAPVFWSRLQRDVLPRFADIKGIEIIIGGEAESTQETTGELGKVAVVVVFGIAMVIWIMLGSLLETLFVISVIPFAFAGVVLAFFLHGLSLSMFAMIGIIGLAGVVVNASIVMADAVHRLSRQAPDGRPSRDVLLDAIASRLRPILITTLTTLGGVMPTAYGIGGYDSMISPMSVAIGWGLFFTTFITLFMVPVMFSFTHDRRYGSTAT